MFIAPIIISIFLLIKLLINFEYIRKILNNLDPVLFQNIILATITLLIPVAIVMLTDFIQRKSKKEVEANLGLFILLETVLNAKFIVIFSIITLFILSIFSPIGIILSIGYIIRIILGPFKNIWKRFFIEEENFVLKFLKKLNIKKEGKKMIKSYKALRLGKEKNNEKEFTNIFISHINQAIENYDFELAIELTKTYEDNIDKRYYIRIGELIRPKILERSEKSQTTYFSKTETNELKSQYQDSYYFQQIIFEKIIKKLLNENQEYILMEKFKEHINDLIPKITNKEKLKRYTKKIFKDFFGCLFENIREKWSYPQIPESRKINTENLKQDTTSNWLLESYIEFFYKETFKNTEYSTKLNSITMELFPNTDGELLGELLFISKYKNNIRYLLNNSPYFGWVGKIRDCHYSINATREKKIAEMEKEYGDDKEETYNIYAKYINRLNIKEYEQIKEYINNFKTTEELAIYRKEKLLEIIDELIKRIKENTKK